VIYREVRNKVINSKHIEVRGDVDIVGDIKITIINDYLKNWESFASLRNNYLENVNFSNDYEKFILLLSARINSLCDEILILVKNNMTTSCQIIMRSVLELYIDLKCLVDDPNYIDIIYQSERVQEIKYYKNHSSNNPYYNNFSREEAEKKLQHLLSENDKQSNMIIKDKFNKAGALNLFYTVYNNLCRHSHGNITALASKTFHNGKILINLSPSETELNFICSSTINFTIVSTIEVMSFFKFNKHDIESINNLLERNKEQALKFKEIIQSSK